MDRIYTTGFGDGKGYLGDEDNGAMSSWYVFSALGFFPCTPARAEYTLGSPLFTKATIHLENGKDFIISAPGNSAANKYVQSATLNGVSYSRNFLRHADILAGGTLQLTMGSSPSTWGGGPDDVPGSLSPIDKAPTGLIDLAKGGSASASGENSGGESAGNAFDDNSSTRWRSKNGPWWIQYKLPNAGVVGMYTLTSSETASEDPKDWTLQGSNNGTSWTDLDTRKGQSFRLRSYIRAFAVDNSQAYSYYRILFNAGNGGANIQLGEVELLQQSDLMKTVSLPPRIQPRLRSSQERVLLANGRCRIPQNEGQPYTRISVSALDGHQLRSAIVLGGILDLQRDFNLPQGTYIIRIENGFQGRSPPSPGALLPPGNDP
jgi:hypothetical protein